MFGGGDRSRANFINEKARGAADMIPFLGDAVGVDETKRAFDEGNYGEAALSGITTAAGAVPGVGDLAAAGLKGGAGLAGNAMGAMAKHWGRGGRPPKYKDIREMFHGTTASEPFEEFSLMGIDEGVHTTDDPDLASLYAGVLGHDKAPEELIHSRIYPVTVDAGKVLSGDIQDSGNWLSQLSVMRGLKNDNNIDPSTMYGFNNPFGSREQLETAEIAKLKDAGWRDDVNPGVKQVFNDVAEGAGLGESMKLRGYDSLEYSHENPISWRDAPSTALLTLDPQRVIPRLSPKGLTLNSSPAIKRGRQSQISFEDVEHLADYFKSPEYFPPEDWEWLR
jgi:hypothetical protein